MIVLVESHTRDRATRTRSPAPDAGARWGKASRFDLDRSGEDAEMERRGGFTVVHPGDHVRTVRVENLSPVWRRVEVVRIPSRDDPSVTEEASVTRALLCPIGAARQNYRGAGTGYVEDTGGQPYEERIVHTFLLLSLQTPVPDAPVVRVEEEGAWPDLPTELFPPGSHVALAPIPGNWHR